MFGGWGGGGGWGAYYRRLSVNEIWVLYSGGLNIGILRYLYIYMRCTYLFHLFEFGACC